MNILDCINVWRGGCSCTNPFHLPADQADDPVSCPECTNALIDAIESRVVAADTVAPELMEPLGVNLLSHSELRAILLREAAKHGAKYCPITTDPEEIKRREDMGHRTQRANMVRRFRVGDRPWCLACDKPADQHAFEWKQLESRSVVGWRPAPSVVTLESYSTVECHGEAVSVPSVLVDVHSDVDRNVRVDFDVFPATNA